MSMGNRVRKNFFTPATTSFHYGLNNQISLQRKIFEIGWMLVDSKSAELKYAVETEEYHPRSNTMALVQRMLMVGFRCGHTVARPSYYERKLLVGLLTEHGVDLLNRLVLGLRHLFIGEDREEGQEDDEDNEHIRTQSLLNG